MKMDLLHDKTADEIKSIWLEYHKQKKDVLVAAIPTDTYNLLTERSNQYPIFLLPLPRSEGYEFFVLQFAANSVHFTPLLCYQVRNVTITALAKPMAGKTFSFISNIFHSGSQRKCARMPEYRALHRVQQKMWNRFDAWRI